MTNLEGGPAAKPGQRARWVVAGVGALAVLAAGATWVSSGNADEPMQFALASPSALPNSRVADASAPAAPAPVIAATIREEAGPSSVAFAQGTPPPAPLVRENKQALKDMPSASPEPAAKAGDNVLSKALESPSASVAPVKPPRASQANPEKKAGKTNVAAKTAKPATTKEKSDKPGKPKPKAEPDSDVTLLAALVARSRKPGQQKEKPVPVSAPEPD